MAIKRAQRLLNKSTLKYFIFEDTLVGIRQPNVEEFKRIAKAKSDFQKTVREDMSDLNKLDLPERAKQVLTEGDTDLAVEMQEILSLLLCCDPENPSELWFAQDDLDYKRCLARGIDKDQITDVAADFHAAAYQTYMGVPNKYTVDADGKRVYPDPEPEAVAEAASGETEEAPLEVSDPEPTTTEIGTDPEATSS